jgi:hypothetical protein
LCGNGWLYDWSNIPGNDDPTQQTVCPLATASYSITLTDGIDVCYDTIQVTVTPLIADATTTSAALLCPDCAVLDAFFTNSNAGSIIDSFDPVPDMTMWDNIQSGTAGLGCTGNTGNALHFDGEELTDRQRQFLSTQLFVEWLISVYLWEMVALVEHRVKMQTQERMLFLNILSMQVLLGLL